MARGTRSLRRQTTQVNEEGQNSFWMSYSDLMSALLLVFALFLLVAVLNVQETSADLLQKNQMIEERFGVKTRIIAELNQSFKNSNLKDKMKIDEQTGAITFDGGVFFEKNSSAISPEGKKNLELFIPEYVGILLSDKYRDEVSQIVIEGHTDQTGEYLYNLNLSQDRASMVVQTIYSPSFPNFQQKQHLQKVITANGRSFSVPVKTTTGQIDADKSRRVEFKFRLKDEELFDEIRKAVENNE